MTKRSYKKGLAIIVGLAVVVVGGMYFYATQATPTRDIGAGVAPPPGTDPHALIEAGRYLAVAGDCIACHSTAGGKPFAGGLAMATPIGTLYSSNITPDRATGIGNYSLNDFDRALRHGIRPDGATLYPAMPYPSYSKISDEDMRALYAYFMHGVEPAQASNRNSDIHWPLSIRWPLGIWRKTFAPDVPAPAPVNARYADASIARGAYLVQGLGHCGSCHTPRAATLQELSLDDTQVSYLSGGPIIDGWFAVNLRGNNAAGLGRWSSQDIVDTLRGARNARAAVVGEPMAEVVTHSMQNLSEPDLQSIAAYLKTLSADPGEKSRFAADGATAKALMAGQESGRGAQLYLDNCAACHRSSGEGAVKVFPALAGNPTVLAADPASLIRLVLAGSNLPSTHTAPSNLGMPGFAWRLSDEETAQLVTFIRQNWGNSASAAASEDVANIRKALTLTERTSGGLDKAP